MLSALLQDYTLRTVALGALTLGAVSGALGTYAVLRRQSLVGDAISHAALPGIALAFLLTGSKAPLVLLIGAGVAGWLAMVAVGAITRTTRVKFDSALGLALSVFFGLGLMLLTYIQRQPDATQAGLEKFLFGQAATVLIGDVQIMAVLSGLAMLVVIACWKELKLLAFDPEFGRSLGLPTRRLDVLLTTLTVLAIVIGLQMVGVVLMSAVIVAPAAAARQWTDRFHVMFGLSALFGAAAGVAGAIISSTAARLPTGPTIVLSLAAIVTVSLLLAPNRGLIWRWGLNVRARRLFGREGVLLDLYALARQHEPMTHAHSVAVLRKMRGESRRGLAAKLRALESQGWVASTSGDLWAVTPEGIVEAERLLRQLGMHSEGGARRR